MPMLSRELITSIIEDGTRAPSGENCQPWRFSVEGNRITIFNIPERDQSLYNADQKGSYVAHGALAENICISAAAHGCAASVEPFPALEHATARITLTETPSAPQPLYPFIAKRSTNRKAFSQASLTSEQKAALLKAGKGERGSFALTEKKEELVKVGKAVSLNEEIIFSNKKLHDFFYDHVLWNPADEKKASGFYYKTLEFLPHQLPAVKLFKHWKLLSFLNRIGNISGKIAAENAAKYAASPAMGAVVMRTNAKEDFFEAGRIIERVWLTAASLGLSIHPCTGVLYFRERLAGDKDAFSADEERRILNAYSEIVSVFGNGTIPMLVRIGHAEPPTAVSYRLPPEIAFS